MSVFPTAKDVEISGWLYYHPVDDLDWIRRWVVVTRYDFILYLGEKEYTPLMTMPLRELSVFHTELKTFVLSYGDTDYEFRCADDYDYTDFITAIMRLITREYLCIDTQTELTGAQLDEKLLKTQREKESLEKKLKKQNELHTDEKDELTAKIEECEVHLVHVKDKFVADANQAARDHDEYVADATEKLHMAESLLTAERREKEDALDALNQLRESLAKESAVLKGERETFSAIEQRLNSANMELKMRIAELLSASEAERKRFQTQVHSLQEEVLLTKSRLASQRGMEVDKQKEKQFHLFVDKCKRSFFQMQLSLDALLEFRQAHFKWLRRAKASQDIARWGLSLKRAGQICKKIDGIEQMADEFCLAWPVVKDLVECPRLTLEEDELIRRMGEIVATFPI